MNSYTHALTHEQVRKLRALLEESGFEFAPKEWTIFFAQKNKLSVAVYEKGPKVLVQGRGVEEFVQFELEPKILGEAELGYEEVHSPKMFEPHFGVDESGKGDFFGPLVISGVYTDRGIARKLLDAGVVDSKRIRSDARIRTLAETIRNSRSEAPVSPASRTLPEPASVVGQTLARMRTVDRAFDPGAFLDGAEKAFRMIVAAFAAGDRKTLQSLLSEETYRAFEQAIAAREAAGQTQLSTIHGIHGVTIEAAELRGSVATVTVKFVSDQTSLTQDRDGHPVTGTDAVTEITDIWTFERNLSARDPAWRLISARSA